MVTIGVYGGAGVGGRECACANSARLQTALAGAGVAYEHHEELAPTTELPANGAAALFCVERDPEACHRSIIAERLAAEYDVAVSHLRR